MKDCITLSVLETEQIREMLNDWANTYLILTRLAYSYIVLPRQVVERFKTNVCNREFRTLIKNSS